MLDIWGCKQIAESMTMKIKMHHYRPSASLLITRWIFKFAFVLKCSNNIKGRIRSVFYWLLEFALCYQLSANLWCRQWAECLTSYPLRAIDSAPGGENQSRLHFPGENYQSSASDVKYHYFFFLPGKHLWASLSSNWHVEGPVVLWHTESECQMDPRDNLLNSFGPQIFCCTVGNFCEGSRLPGCV